MIELSVVLICKDQEWNVARLIESVLRETASLRETEVVLVDSASGDRTAEIAARYPISVLRLRPDQRLTAAAGRYVGTQRTSGGLVLFLDGDMELCEGWLERALALMRTRLDAAVVCGQVIDRPKPGGGPDGWAFGKNAGEVAAEEVRQGGGASLYRRLAFEQVGKWNPYLYSEEEPELCLRLRNAGFRVLRLARPIVFHYSSPARSLSTLVGRRKRNLWLGFGQNIRYLLGSPLLWRYLRERGWAVVPALVFIACIIAAAVSALTGHWEWLALWTAIMAVSAIGIAIVKRSFKGAIFSLFQRLLVLEGTIRGLLMRPLDPAQYSGSYEVIAALESVSSSLKEAKPALAVRGRQTAQTTR